MVAAPETVTPTVEKTPQEITLPVEPASSTAEVEPEAPEVPVTKESATELLNLGKRNVFCGNMSEAVNNLSDACEQFNKLYGEQNAECALVYYWYGYALLELARIESDVLGNAMKGVPTSPGRVPEKEDGVVIEDPDKLTEDEKAEVEQQVSEALDTLAPPEETEGDDEAEEEEGTEGEATEEEGEAAAEPEGTDKTEKPEKAEKTEEKPTEDKTSEKPSEEKPSEQPMEDEPVDESETTDDEEDDSLKLAWEMLEMARNVYQASSLDNKQDMLSRCFLKLGEVLMETGHHDDADAEFQKCLEIQTTVLERCDRAIGEAYFVAGLNMINAKKSEKAKEYIVKAIECIKEKQFVLNKKKDSLAADSSEIKDVETELGELKELLPNMEEKLQDAEAQAKESTTATPASEEAAPVENEDKKATDIGHLVKRKQPEESKTEDCETHKRKTPDDNVSESKKAKLVTDAENNEKVVAAEV